MDALSPFESAPGISSSSPHPTATSSRILDLAPTPEPSVSTNSANVAAPASDDFEQVDPAIQLELEWQSDRLAFRDQLIEQHVSQELQDELAGPYVDHPTTEQTSRRRLLDRLLSDLARDQGLRPPSPGVTIQPKTVDYLLRLIVHPLTTSPHHPALAVDQGEKDANTFQLYMRCDKGIPMELLHQNILRFIKVYKSYQCDLHQKLKHLENLIAKLALTDVDAAGTVYTRYFGQTIAATPLQRHRQDTVANEVTLKQSMNAALFTTWIKRFTEADAFTCYEVIELRQDVSNTKQPHIPGKDACEAPPRITPQDIWLSRRDLQDLEHMVVLAGKLGSMNSAPGGLAQRNYLAPIDLAERHFPTPSVHEFAGDASKPTELVEKHLPTTSVHELADDASVSTALAQEVIDLYMQMRAFWIELGETNGESYGVVGKEVATLQAKQALGDGVCLLLGKEITVRDSSGNSTFWSTNAGPGPQLWHHLDEQVSKISKIHPFADLWNVTTAQTNFPVACLWLYKLLKIIKPKVILSMSYLASTALEANPGKVDVQQELVEEWQINDERQLGDEQTLEVEWDDKRKGKGGNEAERWLQQSGKVFIFQQSVVITMLHPGYFAYNPSFQRLLYPVYLCQVALYNMARALAFSGPGCCEKLRDEIISRATTSGLLADLGHAKEKAYSYISTVTRLRRNRIGWDAAEEAAIREAATASALHMRKVVLEKQIPAKGSPHSDERREQLEALCGVLEKNTQTSHSLEAGSIKRGSEKWWKALMKCKEGTALGLSINAAAAFDTRHSDTNNTQEMSQQQLSERIGKYMEHVRSKIARSVPISGYSENRQATITQGMDYVSDSTNFDTNKQSCLLRCDCSVCGKSVYLFGLSNLHFCQSPTELGNAQAGPSTGALLGADPEVASVTTTTTSLGDANSPVEITKIVYPPLLFYGANLNSDDRYEIVRDDAGRVISIVRNDTGTVALREGYRAFQVELFLTIMGLGSVDDDTLERTIDNAYRRRARVA